jgi:hypothetical protein
VIVMMARWTILWENTSDEEMDCRTIMFKLRLQLMNRALCLCTLVVWCAIAQGLRPMEAHRGWKGTQAALHPCHLPQPQSETDRYGKERQPLPR